MTQHELELYKKQVKRRKRRCTKQAYEAKHEYNNETNSAEREQQ